MNTAVQSLTVVVADVRAEAKDVVTLELRPIAGGELPAFTPGAHLDVHLPNGLVRNYSLTNDWRERNRYVIGVGRAADSRGGSSYIHSSVRAGVQLKISAPRNNFELDESARSRRVGRIRIDDPEKVYVIEGAAATDVANGEAFNLERLSSGRTGHGRRDEPAGRLERDRRP